MKKILVQALASRKLPNAYLFTGPEGTGKDAAAIELAKAVNCLNATPDSPEACDHCENCTAIGNLSSPLLHFIFAVGKGGEEAKSRDEGDETNDIVEAIRAETQAKARDPYHNIEIPKAITISVGQIRRLIAQLSRSVTGSGKRIVIISEADTMKKEAQNAFLKTLEEPHQNTLIILTSSNPSRLYPTILSRCQDLRFEMLSPREIADALVERDGMEPAQAEFLARLSGGSYAAARTLASNEIAELRKVVVQFLQMSLSGSHVRMVGELDTILPRRGGGSFLEKRQSVERFLQLLELWLRDGLAIASGASEVIFNVDQQDVLGRFSSRFGSAPNIMQAVRAIEDAKRKVALQLQLRTVMFELGIELSRILTPIE